MTESHLACSVLNRLLNTDVAIGNAVVYVGADGIGVPTVWNAGGWKDGGGIGEDPAPAGAALVEIG